MVERIPPHNEEAERCALGASMLSKDALYDVIEEVTADDFYNGDLQGNHGSVQRKFTGRHADGV